MAQGPLDADASPDAATLTLQERINQAVQRIDADTCFLQTDTSACEWSDFEVGPAHFNMAVSTGEAILVVDGFGAGLYPQFVRYRNRILGFYEVNGDSIEARTLSVHLPKALGESLISFAGPEFIPAKLLAPVGMAAGTIYRQVSLLFLGHGGVIFSHLVELAPEQPLVLLELTDLLDIPPALCDRVDSGTLAVATAHFTAVAASIRQVMSQHNVRFVNASFGTTTESLAMRWPTSCGGAAPSVDVLRQVIQVFDPVYDVLFHTEGVVTAQAATNVGNPADFPFDQVSPRFANRIRVGFISSQHSGLDELGRGTVQKVEQFPRDGDADVYLNWDCEAFVGCADPHYEMAGNFGLLTVAVVLMSTSYINPLGIGRVINLRYADHATEPMTDELIQTLKQELTPPLCGGDGDQPCVFQDPIVHRQLEVYRRHYQ